MDDTQEYEPNKWAFFKSFNYECHPAQRRFHESTARFRILTCGRRWGKSLAAAHEALFALLIPESVGWIVAPSYDLAERCFRICYWSLQKHAPQLIERVSYSQGNMEIKTKLGSTLKAKSADNPDSLIGEGLHWLVIDEAARVKNEIWEGALRPALADKKGWGVFISTPKGSNWFKHMFTRGQDKMYSDHESFTFPSQSNPYLDPAEIENARLTTPETLFRQEWLAQFIDDTGGVFRKVKDAIVPVVEPQGHGYAIGIDLAKHEDFTVIIVIDRKTSTVVHFERFNQLDWNIQCEKIVRTINKYPDNVTVIDSTGVGDGIYDVLQKKLSQEYRTQLIGFKITNSNKKELIDNLALAIETQEVHYPAIAELIDELQIYTYKMSESRNVTYGAPSGYHDDCVIALALAHIALKQNVGGAFVFGGFGGRK